MRGGLGRAIASVSIVLSIVAISRLMVATADELLANGGFENGTAGWVSDAGLLDAVCGSAPVVEGNCAGRFVANMSGSAFVNHALVPVQPGASYTLSAFILKNDARVDSVSLRITWYDDERTQSIGGVVDEANLRQPELSTPVH